MSRGLYNQGVDVTTDSLSGASTPETQWQEVLNLGRQLLVLGQLDSAEKNAASPHSSYPDRGAILSQRSLIISTTGHLLKGKAELWLPRWLGVDSGYLYRKVALTSPANLEVTQIFTDSPNRPLMRQAFKTLRLCAGRAPDFMQDPSGSEMETSPPASDQQKMKRVRRRGSNALAVPLQTPFTAENPVLGVLYIERSTDKPFKRSEQRLFEGLASQAAIALQASQQMSIERWRVEQLSLVRQVSLQLVKLHDLDELARRVTRLILDTFDYYYVALFTLEPGKDALQFRSSAGPDRTGDKAGSEHAVSLGFTVVLGQGLIGNVAQSGREILANDVQRETRYRYDESLSESRSEFTLPLIIEDRVLGVLDVQSDILHDFHQMDRIVLRALADNIALAVESIRLYSDLQRRVEQLAMASDVSRAIASILDLDQLIQEVVNLIQGHFGFPFVHLYSVHPGRQKIFYEAGSGARNDLLSKLDFAYDLNDPQGIIPWVARSGQSLLVNDVSKEPRYRPAPVAPGETHAELTIPLKFGLEVLGVLDIQSDQIGAFIPEHLVVFETLADNIAIAMRNASLYRSERWRRQTGDSLREVAGLLSADVDLDQVLSSISTQLERLLPCDLVSIWLLEGEPVDQESDSNLPPLRLADVCGGRAAWWQPQVGLNLDDIFELVDPEKTLQEHHTPGGWFLETLKAEQPVIRPADALQDTFGLSLGFSADYSAIAAPLRIGEKYLGALVMAHHSPGRYGSEARAMTSTFASYAAVAIENTRLYEAAHEQVWVSTALLQVAEATQALTDLNELLATVVQITPTLGGVTACIIYLLDEDEIFIPSANSALDPKMEFGFEHISFAPGEIPALDQMRLDRQPTIVQRHAENLRLTRLLSSEADISHSLDLLVLVPLLAHGDVLGAMLVNCRSNVFKSNAQALEDFFDERLPIIQGIAHQTATAVENILLQKNQKEEAYISVALLQVAQAVVTSNDLDEALGAIVRITPMLIGVSKVAIYLLDGSCRSLRPSQSYGLPRHTSQYSYDLDEFPLAQTVLERDSLVAYPLIGADLDWDDAPEVWTRLPAPTAEEVDGYLTRQIRLLLAFPLSIKGNVQGILLIEEPKPSLRTGPMTNNNSLRLRNKRLEIISGISNQAALAIQTEQFRKETLDRERLEREMQLAREIQQTFLPRQTPNLPGWEIKVWWRTAREMGGDFYDFFDLPGNRIGLVIADVADKGMPAALFMTLIRTLVRATVREIDSPGEVLQNVNDLLVPDAQQSMFVTLFYATLDPATGLLCYANGGHNPPLWVRKKSRQIQQLPKGGMALGVMEGIEMEERTIQIEQGDFLVLYTDGVTDAFSPQFDIFGFERLYQVVHQVAFPVQDISPPVENPSAQTMLQTIDAALEAFVGVAPQADDSTAVVFYRA